QSHVVAEVGLEVAHVVPADRRLERYRVDEREAPARAYIAKRPGQHHDVESLRGTEARRLRDDGRRVVPLEIVVARAETAAVVGGQKMNAIGGIDGDPAELQEEP